MSSHLVAVTSQLGISQVTSLDAYKAAVLAEIDMKIARTGVGGKVLEHYKTQRDQLTKCRDIVAKAPAASTKRLAAATYHVATSAFAGEFQSARSLVVQAMREAVGAARGSVALAVRTKGTLVICPAYPLESTGRQSRLVMGEKPTDIFPGLSNKEAHQALTEGGYKTSLHFILREVSIVEANWRSLVHPNNYQRNYIDPRKSSEWDLWIETSIRTDVPGMQTGILQRERTEIARWLAACWIDPERKEALLQLRVGNRIGGRYMDRLDEIRAADLADGVATGVARAFERADARAMEADRVRARDDERYAADSHVALREPPAWYKPLRGVKLLLTRAELASEGKAMHHCVGSYSYRVAEGDAFIVAVAVPEKRPRGSKVPHRYLRSTAEIDGRGQVKQHRGTCNSDPPVLCRMALDVALYRWFGKPLLKKPFRSQANREYARRMQR